MKKSFAFVGLIGATLIFGLSCPSSSFADGKGTAGGGGGNFSGLDAAAALKLVPQKLSALGADLVTADQLNSISQLATSPNTVVAISPNPIPVEVVGIIQNSSAYTVGGKSSTVMVIYQGDWDTHKAEPSDEIAFMTHEACVALGIEKTGQYGAVSANILNRLRKEPNTETTVKKTFEHPLVEAPGQDYPGFSASPSWVWVIDRRPILFSTENAKSFCVQHGYSGLDRASVQHETFYSRGYPNQPIVADTNNNQSQFDNLNNRGFFKGEVISSITCTE